MRGQKDAAELRLVKGANLNAADIKGNTALLRGLLMGRMDFAKFLVDANADVNAGNGHALTPLFLFSPSAGTTSRWSICFVNTEHTNSESDS